MKRANKVFLLSLMGFLLCMNLSAKPKNQNKKNDQFPKPTEIEGKTFEGENSGHSIKYEFNSDGTFKKTVDNEVFDGKWEFDEKSYPMMAYTFDWVEDENKKGYLITIMKNKDGTISFSGYWYLTDAYITLLETVKEVTVTE